MVEASGKLACIFVDCDWGKKNQELSDAFRVRGYPTVILCDPEGRGVAVLNEREPGRVAAHLSALAAKFSGEPAVPSFPEYSAAWLAEARRTSRPLAIYFHDGSPGSDSVNASLADALLRDTLRKFVFTKIAWRKGSPESVTFDVDRAPLILVLDPALPKPEEKPLARIVGSRSARELQRDLAAALAPEVADAPRGGSPSPPPPPKREEENLSDDELERKFIQANLFLAREWLRKGDKDKAAGMLRDLIKSYPNHAAVLEARKLLEETLRK